MLRLAGGRTSAGVASVHTPLVLHPDLPLPEEAPFVPDPRSASGYGYAPGTRAASAGWPRTPSQLKVQQPRPGGYEEYEYYDDDEDEDEYDDGEDG